MAYKFEGDRYEFLNLLDRNPGLMIFKYTAEWCKPCQSIKKEVDAHFKNISGQKVVCFEIDIDKCFDLFAFMKTKKMMKDQLQQMVELQMKIKINLQESA